jgi:predicted secreted hydrolase
MMRVPRLFVLSILIAMLCACGPKNSASERAFAEDTRAATGIRFLAGADSDGFERAYEPRDLVFPTDHGSHEGFRNEWWYFTGNLFDASGRHFGFELTFFRFALTAQAKGRESKWAATELWMAHFTVTDTSERRFHSAERLARGALDLAGATSEPLHIWVKDWLVRGSADANTASLSLAARDSDASISLALSALKPLVVHGNHGLDSKGPEPGNASFYYSFPRLAANGSITMAGQTFDVTVTAWMDREWGSSALSPGVVGWEWFALQLSDGRELMFYRLRDGNGNATSYSGGTLIERDGTTERLGAQDVELSATRRWISPSTGNAYPIAWRLRIPRHRVQLTVEPVLDNQELDLSVRYWEGAVRVTGAVGDQGLKGVGYLELAGY